MPTLDCETDRRGGLTLVECIVHNDTADRRRIRVENRLDGPVRAPPAGSLGPSWTDGAATCLLAPGERTALGYASPAPPRTPPVDLTHEVAEREPAHADETAAAPTVPAPRPPNAADRSAVDSPGREEPAAGADSLRPDGAGVALPPAVASWLDALERRVVALEDGRRDRPPGHATVVADGETLAALERRAAALRGRLRSARESSGEPGS